ncbi:unnamed protein product, partial [Nesidiocoris tenuis]
VRKKNWTSTTAMERGLARAAAAVAAVVVGALARAKSEGPVQALATFPRNQRPTAPAKNLDLAKFSLCLERK